MDNNLIFAEILPRLPAKSLHRFKSVCKSFKSEISSRSFGSLYLRYQSLLCNASDVIVLHENKRVVCYDLDSSTVTTTIDLPGWLNINYLVGSCNGLLCFLSDDYGLSYHLLVLNPITRMNKDIRLPFNDALSYSYGFAFDHENLDFKIVCINTLRTRTLTTRVYSLNTDRWMVREIPCQTYIICQLIGHVALIDNNLLHWKFFIPSLNQYRVGCFDVCKNEWTDDVLLPRFYYHPDNEYQILDLGVFDGCLYSSFIDKDEEIYEGWVMKEYGIQDSWVKLLSFSFMKVFGAKVAPVAYWGKSNEILIQRRYGPVGPVYYRYNPNSGRATQVTFHGVPYCFAPRACSMYTRSLIDVPGGKLLTDS